MADCQFYLFRDPVTKDDVAIIQIPKTNGVFNNQEVELDEIVGISLSSAYSTVSWNAWLDEQNKQVIVVAFKWHDTNTENCPSDAFRYFIGSRHGGTLPLECITEAEARTVLVIGQLDYFQAVGISADNNKVTRVEVEYIGKVDPEG